MAMQEQADEQESKGAWMCWSHPMQSLVSKWPDCVRPAMQLVRWEAHWVWAYYIQKRPYDQDAMEYLTRHHMHLTADGWGALTQQAREEAVARKLWIPENHRVSWVTTPGSWQRFLILCLPPL